VNKNKKKTRRIVKHPGAPEELVPLKTISLIDFFLELTRPPGTPSVIDPAKQDNAQVPVSR
jgi:hypothetical protein